MSIVPVRLQKEDVKKLDMLVRLGVFKNRSEAIRWILREGMEKKIAALPQADLPRIDPVVTLMVRLASRGVDVIKITSAKTAAGIASQERQRL